VNESLTFIVIAAALLVAVIVFFGFALKSALFKSRFEQADLKDAMMANVAVYREQLTELATEFEIGRMSESEFESAREELAQRLMEDSQRTSAGTSNSDHVKLSQTLLGPDDAAVGVQQVRSPWMRWTLPALAVVIPAVSISLYLLVGSPGALDFVQTQAQGADEAFTPEKLAQMASQLNERLTQEPNNADGWVMLARVERSLSHFENAEKALSKSLSLSMSDDVLIERAEVLAQINHGSFKGEPWSIIQKVLKANPDQGNALLLAGSAAFSEDRYTDALKYWQRVQNLVPPNSPDAQALTEAIAKAQERAGIKPTQAPTQGLPQVTSQASAQASLKSGTAASQSSSSQVSGRVSLSADLVKQVHPKDTVFIYAVPVSGSKMPLAMIRTTVDQLPYDFVLSDKNAMNPAANLSSVKEVTLKARVSESGNAMPQPGDLGVTLGPVHVGDQNIKLTISQALK
jgi:cytochrome c-type biogenesis protein CcmH